jgi:hypothetical protein
MARVAQANPMGLQEQNNGIQPARAHHQVVGVLPTRPSGADDRDGDMRHHGGPIDVFYATLRQAHRVATMMTMLPPNSAAARLATGCRSPLLVCATSKGGARAAVHRDAVTRGHSPKFVDVRRTSAPCQEGRWVVAVLH